MPVDSILGPIRRAVARDWGLSPTTQVVAGTSDNQTAALGAGSIDDGAGYICVGTTSWLSCHVPVQENRRAPLDRHDALGHSRSQHRGRRAGSRGPLPGGRRRALAFRRSRLSQRRRAHTHLATKCFAERLARPAGLRRTVVSPLAQRSGPPAANGDIRGGFLNQTLRTGRAQAVRAVLEGVAFNLRWLLPHVERFVGKRFERLRFVAGRPRPICGARFSRTFSNRPIHRVAEPRMATVRGAALHALMSLGIRRRDEISALVPIAGRFRADPGEPADLRRAFRGASWLVTSELGDFSRRLESSSTQRTTKRRIFQPWHTTDRRTRPSDSGGASSTR